MENKVLFTPHKWQHLIEQQWSDNRFGIVIAHRRFGKSLYALQKLIREALQSESGSMWFGCIICPTIKHAKSIHWRVLEEICKDIGGVKLHRSELSATFRNGAQIKLLGAENFDSIRGIGANWVILDEAQMINPTAWTTVILPILSDRRGKALLIGTPQGHNFLYTMWNHAETDDNWFREIYTIEDTKRIDDDIMQDAKSQMSEEEYNAEYMCSFDSDIVGSYYGKQLKLAEDDGRIGNYPWRADKLVHVAMDLGMDDMQALWFYQKDHNGIFLIDFMMDSDEPHQYYLKYMKEKPYTYGKVYLPFDAKKRSPEREDKKSRFNITKDLGFKPVGVKKLSFADGINKTRTLLSRCYFDINKCDIGIQALKQYRKEVNDKMSVVNKIGQKMIVYKEHALHDWASHPADAFRYLAVSYREPLSNRQRQTVTRKKKYRIFDNDKRSQDIQKVNLFVRPS